MFTLCASYTVYSAEATGFCLEEAMGNRGTFVYPIINWAARLFRIYDIRTLDFATEYDRNRIFDLRERPYQVFSENGTRKPMKVRYELSMVQSLSNSTFSILVSQK